MTYFSLLFTIILQVSAIVSALILFIYLIKLCFGESAKHFQGANFFYEEEIVGHLSEDEVTLLNVTNYNTIKNSVTPDGLSPYDKSQKKSSKGRKFQVSFGSNKFHYI